MTEPNEQDRKRDGGEERMSTPTYPEHPPWEPVDGWYWHSGHMRLVSWLTAASALKRWYCITTDKPPKERPVRARLFVPVARPYPDWLAEGDRLWAEGYRLLAEGFLLWAEGNRLRAEHVADLDTLHAAQCPDCPWNGHTILP